MTSKWSEAKKNLMASAETHGGFAKGGTIPDSFSVQYYVNSGDYILALSHIKAMQKKMQETTAQSISAAKSLDTAFKDHWISGENCVF